MAPRDELEHYEATEAQDLTRLLRALRPPARAVQVPAPVDLTIRAEIWQAPVRRQVITLLPLARRDLVQLIRQALTENPLLEEGARAEDEDAPAGKLHAPHFRASADDLTDAAERYDNIWQACVPDGWDASGLPSQAPEAPYVSERPSSPPEALVPDVIVTQVGQAYQAVLNEAGISRLRLSQTYGRLRREGPLGPPEAEQYLDDKLRAAVWLIRSLEYRRRTLSTVAQSLVTRQRAFLDHGLAYLQPLALTEVADALGLHASTVRRVITNKYLATAHGIVALTEFFQSGIESYGGETMSSLTVKDRIKKLVAAEDPAKPLTDQQLVEVLAAENIKIARRTVTQYRRELKLPPANRRQPHGSTAGASRLSPDEEQRVRQALEAHARRRQAESPPQRDREETSGIPPEDEEPQRRRDDEAAASLHQWVEKISGIDFSKLAADPEGRAAYRDLQTVLAHPQLRPAVLLALRAFAQAAQAGATTPPPADAVEPVPRHQERPDVEALSSIHDLDHLLKRAIERVVTLLDIEHASIILLDEARQELYVTLSPKMQEVYRLVERVLHTTATVLLTGERGTGKDRIARIIHDSGPRAQGPFIAVTCAALPETLLEAELFGYEPGAFPDAAQRQPGRLELAAGGTLFLNEIGDMSAVLQAKFLQVLQDRQFERLGGTETITTDARIIAATNQDLERLMMEGRFRPDLFHRLNVYPIALPPLRERQEDLSPLTMFFLKRFSQELRKEVLGISKEAMGLLERYAWPGNVRELENVIERAVILCQGTVVTAQDLPPLREPLRTSVPSGEAITRPSGGIAMADLEKQLIQRALEQAHPNKSQAAKLLGLSRTQLRARMRLYGLE